MATSPQFAAVPRSPQISFVQADGTTPKVLFTMGANGGIVKAIWAVSNDTTARWISLLKNDGSTSLVMASLRLPAATNSFPWRFVNFLDPTRMPWLDYDEPQMHLQSGHGFSLRMETPVSVDKTVAVFALYGEF